LTIVKPGNESPVRNNVLPQSPQKWFVMGLPPSAVLEMVLGVPEVTLKPSAGTTMLVL